MCPVSKLTLISQPRPSCAPKLCVGSNLLARGSLITCRPSVKVDGSAAQPATRAAAESANNPSSHAKRTYQPEVDERFLRGSKVLIGDEWNARNPALSDDVRLGHNAGSLA